MPPARSPCFHRSACYHVEGPRCATPAAVAAAAVLACGASPDKSSSCPSALRASRAVVRAAEPIPGGYVVLLQQGAVPIPDVDAGAEALAREHGARIHATWGAAMHGFGATMGGAEASALAANPRVAWVEEDERVEAISRRA